MGSNDNLLDEDIDLVAGERGSMSYFHSSALVVIDTQNKIWERIISKEKKNYEERKKMLMYNQESQIEILSESKLSDFARRGTSHNLMGRAFSSVGRAYYGTKAYLQTIN